jgi:EAL domain-containing protein (putative c-di-GMP-specific phosphodiesterase class I)
LQPQTEILEALREDQLVLHYQPMVALDTFAITGVEALLRWAHPNGSLLPPDDFLPGIAQAPVMRAVTRRVLAIACRDAARWPGWTVSVNVAATDIVHPGFVDDVVAAVKGTRLDPKRLTLELTEQSVVQDIARAFANLQELRRLGVSVALDDFGTGYSSLLYLRELPINAVKIDRAFVSALDDHAEDAAIVASIVHLARNIHLDVIAEGVEAPSQVRFLQSVACPAAQGYLFARPQPPDSLDAATRPAWTGRAGGRERSLRRTPPRTAEWRADDDTVTQIRGLLADGASLHTIAAALNRAGSTTTQGTRWTARTVAGLVADITDE